MTGMTDDEIRDRFTKVREESDGRPFMLCILKSVASKSGRKLYDSHCEVCGRDIVYSDIVKDVIFICNECIMKIQDLDVDEVDIPCLGLTAKIRYDAM